MNLQKLFKAQKELDDHINKEKGLEGQGLLDKKILALQVELGELANEWRGFKFWSDRQTPKLEYHYKTTGGISGQMDREPTADEGNELFSRDVNEPMTIKNPMLEEYVDCLHFILSIGNELEIEKVEWFTYKYRDLTDLFLTVNKSVNELLMACQGGGDYQLNYSVLISYFDQLGYELGFTWEQIEQAYFEKRETDFERQENGY